MEAGEWAAAFVKIWALPQPVPLYNAGSESSTPDAAREDWIGSRQFQIPHIVASVALVPLVPQGQSAGVYTCSM